MATALCIALIILFVIPPRIYESAALPIYLCVLGLLVAVIFLGIEVKGSRSWFEFGPVRFQPAEISKISTSLMLAAVMSQLGYRIGRWKDFIVTALIILVPMLIIVGQSETGSALVYVGFIFMLYREGLSGWLIFMMGMAILLFILTLTASPFVAILTLVGVSSLCICLYSGRFKWWLIICVTLMIMMGAPTTPSSFIMARSMGHSGAMTANIVAGTTLFSAATVTFWLWLGRILGLVG
jgi:rod shape determining protein RodA